MGEIISQDVSGRLKRSLGHYTDLTSLTSQLAESVKKRYVSPTGNNNSSGTLSSPWRTIQYAVDNVNIGDTVYIMNGTYNERVQINKSGDVDKRITIKNYPGHSPIIDGTGLTWSDPNWGGLVNLNGQSNLTIEGLNLQQAHAAGFGYEYIYANGYNVFSRNITIKNCTVTDAGGSAVYIPNAENILIDNVTGTRTNKNLGQEGISLYNVNGFEIKDCTVIDCLKEGIDAKNGSRNGVIHGCTVNGAVRVAFYVDAYAQHSYNIEVYDNTAIITNGVGFATGAEYGGHLENVLFRNNIARDSQRGFNLSANNSESGLPYKMNDVIFRNNIAFNVTTTAFFLTADVKRVTIENNILYYQSGIGIYLYDTSVTDINEVSVRNNLFQSLQSNPNYLMGTDYLIQSDSNVVMKDPSGILTGTRDFSLTLSSVGIATGRDGIDLGVYDKYSDGMPVPVQTEIEYTNRKIKSSAALSKVERRLDDPVNPEIGRTWIILDNPELAVNGVNYSNWVVTGAGTTLSSSGIHLVNATTTETAKLTINSLKSSTPYKLNITYSTYPASGGRPALSTNLTGSQINLPIGAGTYDVYFTTQSNLTVKQLWLFISGGIANEFMDITVNSLKEVITL
jgi:parallel beta-helix repeat protein